jgi:putative transposase
MVIAMPARRYTQHEPTHDWQQIRPLLTDAAQITYEIIRPVILFGVSVTERSEETGMARRTIYAKANLFDQAGMASLVTPDPVPAVAQLDKRTLPPPIRQEIVDLHAEYPALTTNELATICYVRTGHRPSARTVKLVLASGPPPSRHERRYSRYAEMPDAHQRWLAIIRLHYEGWNAKSIAGYLETSRQTVHTILREWGKRQFASLIEQSKAPHQPHTKVTFAAMREIEQLQQNPALGAYRVQAALEQMGIKLSRATCGRVLALHRQLYGLDPPHQGQRPRKEMPFKAHHRHELWTVDFRHLDMVKQFGKKYYCCTILENFSRAVLASAVTEHMDTDAFIAFLYAAIRRHGCPEALVSDHGQVFLSHAAHHIYERLGIRKEEIKRRQPWMSYIEPALYVSWNTLAWYTKHTNILYTRRTSWLSTLIPMPSNGFVTPILPTTNTVVTGSAAKQCSDCLLIRSMPTLAALMIS